MKREYVGMLAMLLFVGVIFVASDFFGEEVVMDNVSRYIVVWIVLFYFIGQYSMRFPKKF